jgi:hypothetical protein
MTTRLPPKGSRPRNFLHQLLVGPGTFWQICERANIDLERDVEVAMRSSLSIMQRDGLVYVDRITYHLTAAARLALTGQLAAPLVGQVAGPAYRGATYFAPVTVVRRETRAVRP